MVQVWKTLGKKPKQLEEQPEFPEDLRYLWEWYGEVKGPEVFSFVELKAWSELTLQKPKAWEVDVMKTLDRVYWKTIHD